MRGLGCIVSFFSLAGLGLFAGAAYSINDRLQLLDIAETTEGVVIRNDVSRGSDSTTYTPVVEFTYEGQIHTFSGDFSSSPPSFDTGERVPVYFDPNNPSNALIGTFFQLWGVALILGFIGVPMLVMPLVGGFFVMRGQKRLAAKNRHAARKPSSQQAQRPSPSIISNSPPPSIANSPHSFASESGTSSSVDAGLSNVLRQMVRAGSFDEALDYAQRRGGRTRREAKRLLQEIREQEGR